MTMLKCNFLLTVCFERLSELNSSPRKSDFYGCMRTTGFHTWQRDHDKLNVWNTKQKETPLLPQTKTDRRTWQSVAKWEIIHCDINYIYCQTWRSFRKSKLAHARFADVEKQECFDILNDCRQWCAPRSAFSPRFRNILSALLWLCLTHRQPSSDHIQSDCAVQYFIDISLKDCCYSDTRDNYFLPQSFLRCFYPLLCLAPAIPVENCSA